MANSPAAKKEDDDKNKAATKALRDSGWRGENDDPVKTNLPRGKAKGGFGVGARKRQGAGQVSSKNINPGGRGVRFQ